MHDHRDPSWLKGKTSKHKKSTSCIDFLFTNNSVFLFQVGFKLLIFDKCHHNIFGSLYLNIPLPSPYYREVWNYKTTGPLCIERAISLVNRNVVFSNKMANKKLKVSTTSYYHLEILFHPRLSNSTKESWLHESYDYVTPEK